MAVNRTPNLGLHDWLGTEYVKREEIVENFRKIDNEFGARGRVGDLSNKIGILNKRADWISVKEFGAVGDGVADDTTVIQNALNAINTNGGGVLYFPKGIYRITSALVIYDNTTIIGEGKIKVDSAVSSTALTNANYGTDGTLKNYNIKIMNIGLEGGAYTSGGNPTTYPAGIKLGNVVGGIIFNVKVKGFDQDGIILESCENVKVINNYVENGRHGITIAAISSNVSKNIQVIGNYVYNQEDTNILVTENSVDVIISDNICDKTNWGHGIDLAGCSKTIVKGNIIRRTKNISTSGEAIGIYIHDYLSYVSNHNVIEGNLIDVENNPGGSVVGIKLTDESNYTLIRANMIKDATIGISLIGNMSNTSIMPDDFVVCDNILQGITSYGFYIDIVAYGIISNNFINTINTANVMRLHPSTYGLTIQGNRVSGGSTTVTINSNNYLNNNFINNDSPISRPFSTPTTVNDSTAEDVATLKNDFNNLLSKLRAQGILRSGY